MAAGAGNVPRLTQLIIMLHTLHTVSTLKITRSAWQCNDLII